MSNLAEVVAVPPLIAFPVHREGAEEAGGRCWKVQLASRQTESKLKLQTIRPGSKRISLLLLSPMEQDRQSMEGTRRSSKAEVRSKGWKGACYSNIPRKERGKNNKPTDRDR